MTEWLAYLLLAWVTWGRQPTYPVDLQLVTNRAPTDPGVLAEAYLERTPTPHCTILIYTTRTDTLEALWRADLVTHEAGHCLGLGHLPDSCPGVMGGSLGHHFGACDRQLLRNFYPQPVALLPGLVVD